MKSQTIAALMAAVAALCVVSCASGVGGQVAELKGRDNWTEADIDALASNERVMASYLFLSPNRLPQNRVPWMDEHIEIILGRPELPEDYATGVYTPLSSELSYTGIRPALHEVGKRYMSGQLVVHQDLLQKYPDIASYTPRSERNN